MDIDYGQLATHHVKALAAMIFHLVEEEGIRFDLIVGSGNTGILCAKLTEFVYEKLHKKTPPILKVPVLRYKGEEKPENLFDNSILYPEVESFLEKQDIQSFENVLFVDDEIYGGNALKACMKLLTQYKTKHAMHGETTCSIVAEDQGMSSNFAIPNMKSKFYPFATGIDGTSNVITYFMPFELEDPIKQALGNEIGSHTIINILLGLPIRKKGENVIKPEFVYTYNDLAKEKLSQLSTLHEKAEAIVNELLEEGLSDYKEGKLSLGQL